MKKLLLLAALLSVSVSFGQNDRDALKLCSVLQSNSFASNSEAEDALERILGTIGASKRFVLKPCNSINNAIATSYKGIRYILYDPDFMNALNYGNNWGNLFILAHEVGHHINGHSLDLVLYAADAVETISLSQSRQQELEADEFAGFVLARLGGPISSANEVISKISDNSDDSYSTHPSRYKRLAAVERGFNNAKSEDYSTNTKEDLAIEFFYKALESNDKGKIEEAIGFYTTSISLNNNLSSSYFNRGILYAQKNQFELAMSDYNRAINLNNSNGDYFFMRALLNMNLATSSEDQRMYLAIDDLEKAIKINPKDASYHKNLGMCKYRSIGWFAACRHFQDAIRLGEGLPQFITNSFNEYGCN
jgi:tetratricopeptide (TPR) repeat protein